MAMLNSTVNVIRTDSETGKGKSILVESKQGRDECKSIINMLVNLAQEVERLYSVYASLVMKKTIFT